MRRAAKRDDNEAMVVRALGSAGWTVVRVSDAGAPDLLCARMGELRLLEVKGPKGTLTSAQEVAFERLSKAGVGVLVVRTPQEALTVLEAPWGAHESFGKRWFAVNGSFLCESCWLPENGLHAKDCPTRKALARPPKVETAYRAARKLERALPKGKTVTTKQVNAAVQATPDWMAEAVREHHEELKKAKTCARGPCQRPRVDDERFCDIHVGVAILVDIEEDGPRKPLKKSDLLAAVGRIRESRGVEGELQPLPKPCGRRFCRKSASAGGVFCEAHEATNLPHAPNGA